MNRQWMFFFFSLKRKMNQKEKSQPGPVAIKFSGWAGTVVAATLPMLHEERLC
jgi:hypothetical protein